MFFLDNNICIEKKDFFVESEVSGSIECFRFSEVFFVIQQSEAVVLLEKVQLFEGIVSAFVIHDDELKQFGRVSVVDTFYRQSDTLSIIIARDNDRNLFVGVFQLSFFCSINEKEDNHERKADKVAVKGIANEEHSRKEGVKADCDIPLGRGKLVFRFAHSYILRGER
jgi:hypothetical protein